MSSIHVIKFLTVIYCVPYFCTLSHVPTILSLLYVPLFPTDPQFAYFLFLLFSIHECCLLQCQMSFNPFKLILISDIFQFWNFKNYFSSLWILIIILCWNYLIYKNSFLLSSRFLNTLVILNLKYFIWIFSYVFFSFHVEALFKYSLI